MKNPLTRTRLFATLLISSTIALATPLAFASAPLPRPVVPSQCTAAIPSGWLTNPIVNIRMKVIADEDSGFSGYWALDNYWKGITVWQNPTTTPNTFCALGQYSGTWKTFSGALSPQNGKTEVHSWSGLLRGSYVLIFTGNFLGSTGSSKPVAGSIGAYNFGGSQADILLGTYGNGQTGPTTATSWTSFYFTSYSLSSEPVWTFMYGHGDGMGYGAMWVNDAAGSYGDIIG